MRHFVVLSMIVFLVAAVGKSQVQSKALSNEDVIQMVTLGLSDEVIVEKIHSASSTNFDTDLPALKALKGAGASDTVIKAMINPHGTAFSQSSGRLVDEMTTKFKRLQNGVVTVWSEIGHGTGFITPLMDWSSPTSTWLDPLNTLHSSLILNEKFPRFFWLLIPKGT
jgi:hypothetical protein